MQTCDPRSSHPQTRGNGLRVPSRIDGVAMKLARASKRPLHQGQSVKASSMTRLQKTNYHNGQWPECRSKSAHTSPIHGASSLGRVSERPSVMTAPCKSMRQEDQRFAWTSLQINLQASESAIGHRGILPKWGLVPRPLACYLIGVWCSVGMLPSTSGASQPASQSIPLSEPESNPTHI